jgi:hypothetical protein
MFCWQMADWDLVWAKLEPVLQDYLGQLITLRPGLKPAIVRTSIGDSQFAAHATLMRDRLRQEFEDLVLEFLCFPPKQIGSGDTLVFTIQRGTGADLAAMESLRLPSRRDSAEYEAQVIKYVDRVKDFLADHLDEVVAGLPSSSMEPGPN